MLKKYSTDHRLIRKRFTTYKIGTLRVSVVNREKNVGCSQRFFHRLNQVNWTLVIWILLEKWIFFSFFQGYSTLWFRNCDTFIKIRLKTSLAIWLKMLKILDQVIHWWKYFRLILLVSKPFPEFPALGVQNCLKLAIQL